MAFPFPTRSRWLSCCCIVAISITSATIFWRAPRRIPSETNDAKQTGFDDEEADLATTLVNAREIEPILNTASPATTPWSPEPQWNPEFAALAIEKLPHPHPTSDVTAPIPEDFPLQPRLKKAPPAIGEAFANVGQVQRLDSQSLLPASPFVAKPIVAFAPNPPSTQTQLYSTAPLSGHQPPAWPDLTYASSNSQASRSLRENPAAPIELSTPNLLTGATVRPHVAPPSPPIDQQQPSGFTVKPNQPSVGNYILQPMRQ